MLTQEEQQQLNSLMTEQAFTYDEIVSADPEIFELVENGDLDNLQKLLNSIGGF